MDKGSDALYFRLDESGIVESQEVEPGIILDFNAAGHVVGIEMLALSKRVSPDQLRVLNGAILVGLTHRVRTNPPR